MLKFKVTWPDGHTSSSDNPDIQLVYLVRLLEMCSIKSITVTLKKSRHGTNHS